VGPLNQLSSLFKSWILEGYPLCEIRTQKSLPISPKKKIRKFVFVLVSDFLKISFGRNECVSGLWI